MLLCDFSVTFINFPSSVAKARVPAATVNPALRAPSFSSVSGQTTTTENENRLFQGGSGAMSEVNFFIKRFPQTPSKVLPIRLIFFFLVVIEDGKPNGGGKEFLNDMVMP